MPPGPEQGGGAGPTPSLCLSLQPVSGGRPCPRLLDPSSMPVSDTLTLGVPQTTADQNLDLQWSLMKEASGKWRKRQR